MLSKVFIRLFNRFKRPFKDNDPVKIDRATVKRALMVLLIVFAIVLIFKLVDSSLQTWNYIRLTDGRDDLYNTINSPNWSHISANSQTDILNGYKDYKDGASDQLIGVYVNWPLIGLKILIYSLGAYELNQALKENTMHKGTYNRIAWRFVRLTIGLAIGEVIVIWLTTRNNVDYTPRVIYTFVSPAISVGLAAGMAIYFFRLDKGINKNA